MNQNVCFQTVISFLLRVLTDNVGVNYQVLVVTKTL